MDHSEQADAVQRMQDYMEQHLTEPVTLLQLARQAGYSPFHCARLFKEFTSSSPFDYLRRLRLSRAALRLRDEDVRVLDVAFDFVFDSHEGFTRAFSRQFGVTPGRYRRKPIPIRLFIPASARIRHNYLTRGDKTMETTETAGKMQTVFVQAVERPVRKVILKRAKTAEDYFSYCEEVGCDIWGVLCSVKEALYEPIGMWLPDRFRPACTSLYAQGVEVPADYDGEVPEGFELMDLPPCRMLVFQGPPFADEDFCEAIADLWEIMKSYKPELYGFEWADKDGPRFQLAPEGYRGYIEARPVRLVAS